MLTAATARIDPRTVHRLAVGLLLAFGVASILVAIWSLVHGGIGWDSQADTKNAIADRTVHSSWSLAQAYQHVQFPGAFYGVFPYQFADVLHLLTTGASSPLQPDQAVTYTYQGAANLILSVGSVTALSVALAIVFRSVLVGAFAWSLVLATPLWLGMSHVDFKDMPVAAGLTLITAGLVFSVVLQPPAKAALIGALVAGAGGAIALGTRPATLVLIAALTLGTAGVVLAWGLVRGRPLTALPVVAASVSALVCALAFTWSIDPIARIDMVQWLVDSYRNARNFPWNYGPIRVAGVDVRSVDLPYWYVPAWLGAQLPLLTLAALLGGVAVVILRLVRPRSRFGYGSALPLVPIGIQAVGLPLAIVLSRAVLYDGIRHLLYMIPALIAIPAVALGVLERREGERRTRLGVLLPCTAVLVVAGSLWASIRWAPYAYAFINPVAGYDTSHRDWDLDYWGVTAREGVRRLERLGYSPVYVAPAPDVGTPFGADPGPIVTRGLTGLYVFLRWNKASDFGCFVLFTIKRDGHELGEGARCPNPSSG